MIALGRSVPTYAWPAGHFYSVDDRHRQQRRNPTPARQGLISVLGNATVENTVFARTFKTNPVVVSSIFTLEMDDDRYISLKKRAHISFHSDDARRAVVEILRRRALEK